ncbi:hypothetical protein BUZ82_02540 [Staphylococcus saprophyticus]|nr:hypothetical protein BUZ82_02540 [Staphylococcus saprophyticus]
MILQTTFLYLLNHSETFAHTFHTIYPLSENTFILGWLFFFFLGGYIGANYGKTINFLHQYIFIILSLAIIAFTYFVLFTEHDFWNVTSFTYALTSYHTFMFLLLLGICIHFKTIMYGSINLISTFSFFIYLMHPLILDALYSYTSTFENATIIFVAISLLFII